MAEAVTSALNPLVFRLKMAHKVKKVTENLDSLANEKNKFRLTEGVGENEADSFDWRITSSLVNESEIYGRDKEKRRADQFAARQFR
ncbi:hypothetical protein POTOM_054121 [Populus tomentosa]|uniref:Uncharacterized protein n=1 Tax=Populus tomentosa TaxID=118781 RepID=A0A8X7XZ65_POPTO|nr:hypothetical protein POTOM_054121 [Populus tomentosa]